MSERERGKEIGSESESGREREREWGDERESDRDIYINT